MDLLESGDERDAVPLPVRLRSLLVARPSSRAVAGLAAVILLALTAGALAVADLRQDRAREAVRVDVAFERGGSQSSTVGGVARGMLSVLVLNRRDVPVQLEGLLVDVPGLEVLEVDPPVPQDLAAGESLEVRVFFVIADCSLLVLPGVVEASLSTAGGPVVTQQLPVAVPDDEQVEGGVRLGACPASARADPPGSPTDVGLRPAGGPSELEGAGARGVARIEVRNGGERVTLLSLEAEFPGVAFNQRRLGDGRSLSTDEVVVAQLGFRIGDCAALGRTGRLIVTVERDGAVQQLVLRLGEPADVVGEPRLDLPVLLGACG